MGRLVAGQTECSGRLATAVIDGDGARASIPPPPEHYLMSTSFQDVEHLPTSIPPEDLAHRRASSNRRRDDEGFQKMEYVYIGVMVAAILAIAVTLILVFGLRTQPDTIIIVPRQNFTNNNSNQGNNNNNNNNNGKKPTSPPRTRRPTAAPSETPTGAPTVSASPSVSPSFAPTMAPTVSAAPTIKVTLKDSLPLYTRQQMERPSSPQRLAYDWVEHHPEKPNLTLWRQRQLLALVTFYYIFDGPNWQHGIAENWLDVTKHECDWFSSLDGGFITSGADGNNLYPIASQTVCNQHAEVQALVLQDIFSDAIVSRIPNELSLLTSLKTLAIEGTGGGIARSLQFMLITPLLHLEDTLEVLSLPHNNLNGRLPTQMGRLTRLKVLDLSHNEITGDIPTEIGLLTKLEHLKLGYNTIGGRLPTELGLLAALKTLDVSYNGLTGQSPIDDLMFIMNADLVISADGNRFSP